MGYRIFFMGLSARYGYLFPAYDWKTGRRRSEVCKEREGKDSLSRTRRLEELYIFHFEVVTVVNDDFFI